MPTPHMTSPQAKDVEWEVLPPEEKAKRAKLEPAFRWAALIMDGLLRVPGTKWRFGLNPIIDLLPGIGDVSAAFVSGSVLIYAVRHGLPMALLARMAANVLVNEIVGIVPGVGSAFAFWFRCNKRNYDLLTQHAAGSRVARRSDWIFVIVVLVVLVGVIGLGLIVTFLFLQQIAKALAR